MLDSLHDCESAIIQTRFRTHPCNFGEELNDLLNFSQKRSFFVFAMLVIGIQIVLGTFYVLSVPLLMPSDERAHLLYVTDLVQEHKLHKIQIHDEHYEAIQPPLYYVLSASLCAGIDFLDVRGKILVLRFFSFCFYVLATIAVLHLYAKKSPNMISFSVCACYAWCPSLLGICCTITNDSLSFFFTAAAFYWFASKEQWSAWELVGFGVFCGLGLLTKLTFAAVIGVLMLALTIRRQTFANKLKAATLFIVPVVLVIAPWLVWNLTTYGALQPYGSAAKWLVRGTFNMLDVRMYYPFVATFVAYHLSPAEFWLNQFHMPLLMQVFLGLMMFCAASGAIVYAVQRSSRNLESTVSCLAYFSLIAFWLVLTLKVNWEPVRGFLGGYFGFCYLMIWGARVGVLNCCPRFPQWRIELLFPIAFIMINVYLIATKMPLLIGFFPKS